MTDKAKKLLMLYEQSGKRKTLKSVPPLTFKGYGKDLKNYRIYGNTVNGESVGNLVTDSQSEHYGEYAIPITNNSETSTIYLDEPLRKVGDEAEYVDYAEQKQHRVRKNLLPNTATSQTINGLTFTVNTDGSVTCDGTASDVAKFLVCTPLFSNISTENLILTGCPKNGSTNTYLMRYYSSDWAFGAYDYGNGARFTYSQVGGVDIRIAAGYTCDNLTFYPMIRKADIEDDTYEPYIENTEVDVTLPEIAVTAGTNILSVGTTVQPSNITITGKIKQI